jgi:hypothetical protein
MPLQSGDIRLARSAVMADVDSGGGPPTSQLIPDGASNVLFPDISEDARTGGLVEVRQIHGVLRNTDTDALLGANIILADPPDDPNVSITLIKSPSTFARRPDLVKLIEATSTPGPEFAGYLLENHIASQRSIQIAQRPGVEPPGVNTALVLVLDEGLITERSQYVRVRRVTVAEEVFTTTDSAGNPTDFLVQVASCELFSPLGADFAGSPASRFYTRAANKTKVRRVNFSDAGTFYSAARLTVAALATDSAVKLETVYTQIVPNTRTETPLLNQRSGGLRTLDLVDYLGTLQVTASSHTKRIFVTEANQGFSWVEDLQPPPAPNSVSAAYMALGSWNTVIDDGSGALGSGPGSGTVDYSNGNFSLTTDALPDYNTFILIAWADTAPFVNNCPSGPVAITTRPPQFEVPFTPGANVNAATITWPSGGVTQTANVDAAGTLSGGASGAMVSALGMLFIRPTAMPDAGSGFTINYASRPTLVESVPAPLVDAGGYAALSTAQQAIPGTIKVRWITARTASQSSGSDLSGTSSTESSQTLSMGSGPSFSGFSGAVRTRVSISQTQYSEVTQSSTSSRLVVAHEITDDGVGGFGNVLLGSVNYAARTMSLRVVSEGASVTSYQSDHEKAERFYTVGNTITSMSA